MSSTLSFERTTAESPDEASLSFAVNDPMVVRAAQYLINRHRRGQSFDIKAFDVPHVALASISAQLEQAGATHAMNEHLTGALKSYIMANGGSFSRAANAKPVTIHMVVTDRMPARRFKDGVTELAALGLQSTKVEGSAAINVRITPSGTATTSNAADVDAMFQNVRGLYLWVRFEAPTKTDLDGMMNTIERTLTGAAQGMGGAMSASDLQTVLEELQQTGTITPAIETLIESIVQLQAVMNGTMPATPDMPHPAELIAEITTILQSESTAAFMPPALHAAVIETMTAMAAEHPALGAPMLESGLVDAAALPAPADPAQNDNAMALEQFDALMTELDTLIAAPETTPAMAQDIAALKAEMQAALMAEEKPVAEILGTLAKSLGDVAATPGIAPAVFDRIGEVLPAIQALQATPAVESIATPFRQAQALAGVLDSTMKAIENGSITLDQMPPEIQDLVESLGGVEALRNNTGPEGNKALTIADALIKSGISNAEPAATAPSTTTPNVSSIETLGQRVNAAMLVLSTPDALPNLPPAVMESVTTFINKTPEITQQVVTQAVLADLITALAASAPDSVEAAQIRTVMDMIAQDGLGAVAAKPDALAALPPATQRLVINTATELAQGTATQAPSASSSYAAAPSTIAPVAAATIATLTGVLATKSTGDSPTQVPAAEKAVQATMAGVIDTIKTNPAVLNSPEKIAPVLQQLANIADRSNNPATVAAVRETIETLRTNPTFTPDTRPAPPVAEPRPAPGCGPLCKCHGGGTENKPVQIESTEDVIRILGEDIAANVSVDDAKKYMADLDQAIQKMDEFKTGALDTSDKSFQDETARAIADFLKSESTFGTDGHICGEFCHHSHGHSKGKGKGKDNSADDQKLEDAKSKLKTIKAKKTDETVEEKRKKIAAMDFEI